MPQYNVRIAGLTNWEQVEAPSKSAALTRVISRYIPGRYKGQHYTSIGLVTHKVRKTGDYRIEELKKNKPRVKIQKELF